MHIDIVDYPGEWLLDLALLEQSYAQWAAFSLARAARRPGGGDYAALVAGVDPSVPLDEEEAQVLAERFTEHLRKAREAGFSDCSPGRFLLPGDLAGSPVLTFAPLPPGKYPKGSLGQEFERRYESYKRNIVRPFFRDHFSKIDRQIVLVDVLGAIHAGPAALDDLRGAMAGILSAFRIGRTIF